MQNAPERTSAAYVFDHSLAVYLIDAAGQLRTVYSFGTPPDASADGVRVLLAEG